MTKDEALEKAVRAAIASPAYEICGYLLKSASGGFDFYQCENIATDKMNEFEIDMVDTDAAAALGEIVGVVHSHPNKGQLFHLSAFDRLAQYDNCDPCWYLIKPDFSVEAFPPLPRFRGRQYVPMVTDCYSVMKDFYDLCGLRMKSYERNGDWWDEGKNLYLDNIESEGFHEVAKEDIQPGDTMLFCYAASVPNHCGIYIGDNKFLHHMTNRVSKIDILDRFWFKFCHSVWRNDTIPQGLKGYAIDRIKGETIKNG